MLKIVLVEDEMRTRMGLKNLIEKYPNLYTVVGEADNGLTGFDVIKETLPDIVISDIKMPFCDGITMLKNLRAKGMDCKFILLTGHSEFEYAKAAIKYDAEDYILKPMVVSDILQALENVANKIEDKKPKLSIQDQVHKYLQLKKGDPYEIKSNISAHFNIPYDFIRCALIYISAPLKTSKKEILDAINYFCEANMDQCIILNIDEQKVVIISTSNKENHQARDLQDLNDLFRCGFKEEIGILYVYSDIIDTILDDYKRLEEKLHYFLSMGTNSPILLNEINGKPRVKKGIKKNIIIGLENDFAEQLYGQNYNQCMDIIEMLIEKLRGYDYNPGSMLQLFHSLFNQLNQHMKVVVGDIPNISYDKLIGKLSVGKTRSDILEPFMEILTLLEDQKRILTPYSLLVQKALARIDNEYVNAITLKEIADSLGVTHIYLSQLFHKEVKKSFTEYMVDIRMTKAEQLLKTTDLKVYEIAMQVGYGDSRYFCTQFKKYTGLSPSQYKKLK